MAGAPYAPDAELLEETADRLERQAAAYRAMAKKVRGKEEPQAE